MSHRHLVALDIDGTTVTHAGVLRPAVHDAVGEVLDAGHQVVLATGRSVLATVPVIAELGLPAGTAVCSNGAVTVAYGAGGTGVEIVEEHTFDPAPVVEILRGTWPDALVAAERVGVGFDLSAPFPDEYLEGELRVVGWDGLRERPTSRITVVELDGPPEHFEERVGALGLHGVEYAVGWSSWLDITPQGVSKASALEVVRSGSGVPPERTVAVGDQRNDIEMLRWAGVGVAMGGAPEDVVAAADRTTGGVEDDGLAAVLRALAACGSADDCS